VKRTPPKLVVLLLDRPGDRAGSDQSYDVAILAELIREDLTCSAVRLHDPMASALGGDDEVDDIAVFELASPNDRARYRIRLRRERE